MAVTFLYFKKMKSSFRHIYFCFQKAGSFILLAFLLLFIFNTRGFSQDAKSKPEMRFQHIHEGLVSNQVSTIYQDKLGFIWIGTFSGLHRYDGIQFHVYSSTPDSNSISDNYIGRIFEDKDNNLWIGTGGGVEKYNRAMDNFTRHELPSKSRIQNGESTMANSMLEDNNGTLWVSSSGKGLYYFDKKASSLFTLINWDS